MKGKEGRKYPPEINFFTVRLKNIGVSINFGVPGNSNSNALSRGIPSRRRNSARYNNGPARNM